ncbi:MAG TPA: SIMPL domain-containing protein [Bryobacteraceae bacterium]|jgi:uncharacterized protein YggE|nr:SIMPL domain-containing protein [Bryobacteraceae bacterium]
MWKLSFLLLAAPVFAQLESHTLAVSANRSINVQPDQAVFGLSVSSSTIPSLDQIVAALSSLGITSANLSGVGTNTAPPSFQWNFTLPVPFSSLTATLASLSQLQQSIGQNNSGMTLTFSLNGTQVSQQLLQSQSCSNTDLIADATTQAQKLTAAAALRLGPILRLSNVPAPASLVRYADVPSTIARLGSFSFSGFLLAAPPAPLTCSLVVEFQLLP